MLLSGSIKRVYFLENPILYILVNDLPLHTCNRLLSVKPWQSGKPKKKTNKIKKLGTEKVLFALMSSGVEMLSR